MRTHEVLTEALALLRPRESLGRKGRRHRWIQGQTQDRWGRHCMVGALQAVTNEREEAIRTLVKVIREQYPSLVDGHADPDVTNRLVVAFNDEDGRTFAEVEQVFEKAIALTAEGV